VLTSARMSKEPKPILRRYLVLSGANLAAAGLGFAGVLVVARWFGAAGLGDVSLALSISTYALLVAACGTDVYAVKELAARRGPVGSLAASVVAIRTVSGLLTYGAILALVLTVPRLQQIGPLLALFGLSVFATALNMVWVAQARHETDLVAVAGLAGQALSLVLMVGLLLAGSGLWGVAVAKVLADFLVALLSVGWVRKHHGPLQPPTARAPVLDLARAGAPIAGTQLLRGLTRTSDIVILGFMVSRVQLGYYSAAARIFLLMLSLAGSYFVILLPRIAERAAGPAGSMRRELRASLRRTLPIALPGCALVALFARPLLAAAFGSEFAAAAPALQLLTLALVANFVGRHYRQVLIARGRQGLDLRLTGIGAATHVAAKLALIPLFGITGAALGTLAGELTIATLLGGFAWSGTQASGAWLDRREEER